MEPAALTLREAFASLAGQPGAGQPGAGPDGSGGVGEPGPLAGHEGLPDDLLIRAIGSYADTAPAEVAEHLSAFVAAPTGAEEGLHLLAAVPVDIPEGEVSLDGADLDGADPAGADGAAGADELFDVHNESGSHDLDDLGHLGGLENADSLDSLDHAPITQSAYSPEGSAPDVTHDADFGAHVPAEAPETGPEGDSDSDSGDSESGPDDAGHVSLDDLSSDVPEYEADAHHEVDATHEAEDHDDDGHHDPGLDHVGG